MTRPHPGIPSEYYDLSDEDRVRYFQLMRRANESDERSAIAYDNGNSAAAKRLSAEAEQLRFSAICLLR